MSKEYTIVTEFLETVNGKPVTQCLKVTSNSSALDLLLHTLNDSKAVASLKVYLIVKGKAEQRLTRTDLGVHYYGTLEKLR
jgi:hypothetical protein